MYFYYHRTSTCYLCSIVGLAQCCFTSNSPQHKRGSVWLLFNCLLAACSCTLPQYCSSESCHLSSATVCDHHSACLKHPVWLSSGTQYSWALVRSLWIQVTMSSSADHHPPETSARPCSQGVLAEWKKDPALLALPPASSLFHGRDSLTG